MKKLSIVFGLAMLLSGMTQSASAQYYFYDDNFYDNPLLFEVGASVGAMNCLTDIGGKKGIGKKFVKDLNLGKTSVAGSIFLSATYQEMLALRLEATFGQIKGDDKVLRKVKTSTFGRYERNLSFRSNITEFMLAAEIHPLYIFNRYDEDKAPPRASPKSRSPATGGRCAASWRSAWCAGCARIAAAGSRWIRRACGPWWTSTSAPPASAAPRPSAG